MKPAITITEKSIRVSTDAFDMTIEFSGRGVTIDDLKESYSRMNEAINEHATTSGSLLKKQSAKTARTYKPRTCQFCNQEFEPTGPTQRFCTDKCKALSKRKRPLSEMEEVELEKTLQEIEQRRKHYQI